MLCVYYLFPLWSESNYQNNVGISLPLQAHNTTTSNLSRFVLQRFSSQAQKDHTFYRNQGTYKKECKTLSTLLPSRQVLCRLSPSAAGSGAASSSQCELLLPPRVAAPAPQQGLAPCHLRGPGPEAVLLNLLQPKQPRKCQCQALAEHTRLILSQPSQRSLRHWLGWRLVTSGSRDWQAEGSYLWFG